MGKDYYGVATAMVGKDPNVVDIVHTTAAANDNAREEYRIIDELTFKTSLDLRDVHQIRAVFNRVALAVAHAEKLQKTQNDRPLCIAYGKSSHSQYNVQNLVRFVTSLEGHDAASVQALIALDGILKRAFVTSSTFAADIVNGEPEQAAMRRHFESGRSMPNNLMLAAQAGFLSGNAVAFNHLRDFAAFRGRESAQNHLAQGLQKVAFLSMRSPWPDFFDREDLQEKFPYFSFTRLHPEFRSILTEEFKKGLGIKTNVYARTPDMKPLPYFLAITMSMIWDQMDVDQGKNTQAVIADKNNMNGFFNLGL